MSDTEDGWITITGKKKTGAKKVPVEQQLNQATAASARKIEEKADQGSLKQKRVDPASIAELVKARLAAGMTQEAADAADVA